MEFFTVTGEQKKFFFDN